MDGNTMKIEMRGKDSYDTVVFEMEALSIKNKMGGNT